MATRKKTRKQIVAQTKKLLRMSKGNESRQSRIREIGDRYIANTDRDPKIRAKQERNAFLRASKGTITNRELYGSYAGSNDIMRTRDVVERGDEIAKDRKISGLIGMNTAYINNHPFSRDEYMYGRKSRSGLTG